MEVADWLRLIGLPQYAPHFREHQDENDIQGHCGATRCAIIPLGAAMSSLQTVAPACYVVGYERAD